MLAACRGLLERGGPQRLGIRDLVLLDLDKLLREGVGSRPGVLELFAQSGAVQFFEAGGLGVQQRLLVLEIVPVPPVLRNGRHGDKGHAGEQDQDQEDDDADLR